MTKTKLKLCPFCGGSARIARGRLEFWAYCPHCGVSTEYFETPQEAAETWNSRPIEDALQEENLKLRAVVNFYADRKKYKTIIKGDNGEDENFMLRECGRYARNVLWQLERNRENEK